jgi:UDP-N-acetylmuramate dehydrogenase
MDDFEKELQDIVGKQNLFIDEPMSKHTSFRIGGIADYFVKINSVEELKSVLEFANKNKLPFTIIGNGTNLLVREAGIRGLVLKINFNDFKIKKVSDDILITAESGMSLASLSSIALKEEIQGLEFLSGIPGTVGGAIRMNAGAYGSEIKDFVVKSRVMTYDGKIKTLQLSEHQFEYRNSVFSKMNCIIIDTTLKVKKGNKDDIKAKIDELSESRRKSQPLEYPNAGSTFKRKEGVITAKLIDECGLKGYSVGDAEVSTKHAGFIINKGNATAEDVIELIRIVEDTVQKKCNKEIKLEIEIIGE